MASLEFEGDAAKNRANVAKHGIGCARASAVFKDVFAIERRDDRLNYGEERFVIIGMAHNRLLTVAYTPRGDVIRLISARAATSLEKRRYHEENS